MAGFKFQVEHVRYWRGQVHKWSTDYTYNGTGGEDVDEAACQLVLEQDDGMCYGAAASDGGTASCSAYSSAGGVPVATYVAFDADTPAEWVKYGAAGYSSTTSFTFDGVGEGALVCTWPGGKSATGKPVTFRKWYHAISTSSGTGATAQVSSANVASLETWAAGFVPLLGDYGLVMGTFAGRLAGTTPTVDEFYGSHQMVRGRRRLVKAAAKPASSFPPDLLVVPGSDGSLEG